MSDDLDFTDEGEGIKNLRKQYETEKKQRAELEARLAAFEAKERAAQAVDIFKSKGLDDAKAKAAAKLYNGDDVSEDAVGKWLADFADLFPTADSSADDQNAQQAARVNAASFGTLAHDTQDGKTNLPLGDPSELHRLIQTLPRQELEKMGIIPADPLYGPRS